ncbi:hypothetical protein FGO68_gene1610 [Halteria grandinella]|uniref:Uncharacterized protein n=1 Tax=Halteria grandinella TaxID=5974 RepID=A0A8J8N9S2_HALGN|nr:hypothetical protein FGO68_gene1610 [Halteria grandinella]
MVAVQVVVERPYWGIQQLKGVGSARARSVTQATQVTWLKGYQPSDCLHQVNLVFDAYRSYRAIFAVLRLKECLLVVNFCIRLQVEPMSRINEDIVAFAWQLYFLSKSTSYSQSQTFGEIYFVKEALSY